MSVAFILNPSYSYVENNRLNQALEVSTSLKAPSHFVSDIELTKNLNGSLNVPANLETTQLNAPIGVIETVNVDNLIPYSGSGGDISVDGNLDFGASTSFGLKNVSTLTIDGSPSVAGYVLSTDANGNISWIPDAVGSIPSLAQVLADGGNDAGGSSIYNLGVLNADASNFGKTGTPGYATFIDGSGNQKVEVSSDYGGYITVGTIGTLDTDNLNIGAGSSNTLNINLNSNTIVANGKSLQAPTIKADVLDTATPSATQINVAKNLNLSSNILYAQTINAGNTITSANAYFGVEPNRWTGADSYTLKQIDGDNRVVSDSGADLVGWHDIQSKRGKIYATDASDVEKFSATGDGAVSCVGLTTSKINIPSQTPVVGQVLGASNVDGSISWIDNTVYTPTLAEVLAKSNNSGNNNINMNSKYIQNADRVYTGSIWNNSVSQDIVVRLEGTGRVLQLSGGNLDLSNNSITGGNNASIQTINTDSITERNLGSNINMNSKVDMNTNDIIDAGVVYCSQVIPTFSPTKTYYVAKNGNNSWVGNIQAPFLTISKALQQAYTEYGDGSYPIIYIMEGNYVENLVITNKVILKGIGANADSAGFGTAITGDITINFTLGTNGDFTNQQVQLNGIYLNGTITDSTGSTVGHILNLVNSYIYSGSNGHIINFNPSGSGIDSAKNRLWFDNCNIIGTSQTTTNELITAGCGMVKARLTLFQNAGYAPLLQFKGTATCDSIALCSFTNQGVETLSSSVSPLVSIDGITTDRTFTFGNCVFVYTDTSSKSSNTNATAILCNPRSVLVLLYNTFLLAGTSSTQNFVAKNTTTGSYTLFFSNNAGYTGITPQANSISSATKLSFQAVA